MTTAVRLALAAVAIVVPWTAIATHLEPLALRVLVGSAAVLAAFHGLGCAVALFTSNLDSPTWLRVGWGIAAYLLLAGVALAFGALDAGVVQVLVIVALSFHTLRVGAWALFARGSAPPVRLGVWAVPAGLAIVVAAVHLFGSAGLMPASFFDDDGHFLGQLVRLSQTGELSDAIGYARDSQLGGHLTLAALAGLTDDLRTARMIDGGIGLIVTLGLLWTYLRPRNPHVIVWLTFVVLLVSGLRRTSPEPVPFWIAIAMLLAGYFTMARARDSRPWIEAERAVPAALLGGALATLRLELLPVGLALGTVAILGATPSGPSRIRAFGWQLAAMVMVIAPYAVSRAFARAEVPDAVANLLGRASAARFSPLLIGLALASLVVVTILLMAGFRDRRPGRPLVGFSIVAATGLAGLVSGAITGGGYGWRFLPCVFLAWALVALVEIARSRPASTIEGFETRDDSAALRVHSVGYIVALAAVCVGILAARAGRYPKTWWGRYARMFEDAEHLLHVRSSRVETSDEQALLASVPEHSRVAIWVEHPERLDYRGRDIVDLRTPRLGRLVRHHTWEPSSELDGLLEAMRVDYVLVTEDNLGIKRTEKDKLGQLLCAPGDRVRDRDRLYRCADALERLTYDLPTVDERPGLRLLARTR